MKKGLLFMISSCIALLFVLCRYVHLHAVVHTGPPGRRPGGRGPCGRGHPHPLPAPGRAHLLQVRTTPLTLFPLLAALNFYWLGPLFHCHRSSSWKVESSSVAESEPPGAATFRAEPESHFLRRLRLHLLAKQKRKALFLCQT